MEKETKSTRFCLLCNYLSRIIPPSTSRCSKFRFKPLNDDIIRDRLLLIVAEEKVKFQDGVIKALIKTSNGDLRRAITCLQSCVRLKGIEHTLTAEDVLNISGVVPENWVTKLYESCQTGNYDKINTYVEEVGRNGFPAAKIIEKFFQFTLVAQDIDDTKKGALLIGDFLNVC